MPDIATSVLEHVIKGTGNEIGFGAITEIKLYEAKGLRYVGPLLAAVQNYTRDDAVMMQSSATNDAVREVLKLMQEPKTKGIFVKAGVEQKDFGQSALYRRAINKCAG